MSFLKSSAFNCWRTRRWAITASSRPRTRSRESPRRGCQARGSPSAPPRAPGYQRGRHDHAALTELDQFAVDPEPARACLVDKYPLATLGLLFPHHLEQRPSIPADLPHAAHLAALLGQGDIDRFLVHIHADENLARLFHGLPPFGVFAPPCKTCGSARPTRNPRYRGGGPPALERKPFCLAIMRMPDPNAPECDCRWLENA